MPSGSLKADESPLKDGLLAWLADGRPSRPALQMGLVWLRLRVREVACIVAASVLPSRRSGRDGVRVRSGWRRWRTAGDVPSSAHELVHDLAATVVRALEHHGVRSFLVRADDANLSLGIGADDRSRAWVALRSLAHEPAWFVDWRRRSRSGTVPLSRRRKTRSAARATSWRVYRAYRSGRRALAGPGQAVEITFHETGPIGDPSRVGDRSSAVLPMTDEVVDGRTYPSVATHPVGPSLDRFPNPVDAVYTWVDDADPSWRASFERWRTDAPGQLADDTADLSRFRNRDELRYSIRSLWLNAGWVRKIFVVTAGQAPSWLVQDERLRVVDHAEIMPANCLPTFNSFAIECRLHHIEGLAEHFIYLNDDFFLGRPSTRTMFFTPSGLTRFFEGRARVPVAEDPEAALAYNAAARNGQRIIEELFGRVVEHRLEHAPYALRRSVLCEIEERLPEAIGRTIRARFRSADDLSVASAFAHHYAFCTGRAVQGDLRVGYQSIATGSLRVFLDRVMLGRDFDAFCLNDEPSPRGRDERADQAVVRFLEGYFPVSSPWELEVAIRSSRAR